MPEATGKLAKETIELRMLLWDVFAVIMNGSVILTAIGMLLFLSTVLYEAALEWGKKGGDIHDRVKTRGRWGVRFIKYGLLAVILCSPIIIAMLYRPLNEHVLVEEFGCGCPKFGVHIDFNANGVSGIVWMYILFILVWCWNVLAASMFRGKVKSVVVCIGMFVLMLMCARCLAFSFWM